MTSAHFHIWIQGLSFEFAGETDDFERLFSTTDMLRLLVSISHIGMYGLTAVYL
jgi:hypothetical protein